MLAPLATTRSPGSKIFEDVVAGEKRLLVGGAEVGEDHAVALLHRVPGLAVSVAVQAVVGLARLVEAVTLRVEEPAVVAAADADVFDPAEEERRAAVHAARVHEPRVAAAVAEQDEVFTEDADRAWKVSGFLGQRHGMPVPPEELTSRCARVHRREVVVDRSGGQAVRAAIAVSSVSAHALIVSTRRVGPSGSRQEP